MENLVQLTNGGGLRPLELTDLHEAIEDIRLHDSVPDDIWVHFETARNLVLYSWFVYRFQSVGELQALASLEFALRQRSPPEGGRGPQGLRQLLQHAIQARWINSERLSAYQDIQERRRAFLESGRVQSLDQQGRIPDLDPNAYLEQLADVLPRLRNEFAHGSGTLLGQGAWILRLCADLINQLFAQGETNPPDEEAIGGSRSPSVHLAADGPRAAAWCPRSPVAPDPGRTTP